MTGGTLKSEPGFSPAIDAEFVGMGNDYIRGDPSGKHIRLDAHGVVKYASPFSAFCSRDDVPVGGGQRRA